MFVSMLADTIDVQELITGRRQEGIFAAALAFSGKATAGVGADHRRLPAAAGGALAGQVPIRTHRPAGGHPPGPGGRRARSRCCWSIPFALGSRYSITRDKHMLTRQELDRRRAAAHAPPPGEEPSDLQLPLAPVPQITG